MPRGDKSKYTGKQERKADHIAESYESRGVPEMEAERRAWATVNKESGGGRWRRTRRRGNCWPNRRTGLRRNLSNATCRPTLRGATGRPSCPSRPRWPQAASN
jgi:plasmid stabilization system protein ParE